ncbi:MAG: CheR family methyltransferase [Pseudomonadota bacterium]
MSAEQLLRQASGLTVQPEAAERAVRQRMELRGFDDSEAYLAALTPQEMAELIELVVVPESWFFRDPEAFAAFTGVVRARLAADARPVRILSIPCAGGEEPYSMAMALRDAGVAAPCFSIDAFDLSAACVARARSGIYGRNAFRSRDVAFRERHFQHLGQDAYQVDQSIRDQVSIKQGNLLQLDRIACARYYDVIFCRNLLIYFDPPTTAAAIQCLGALLADDGVLFAGYAEVPAFCRHGFQTLPQRQAFALKKAADASAPGEAQLPAARAPARRGVQLTPPPWPVRPERRRAGAAATSATAFPSVQPARAPATRPAGPDLMAQARQLADLGQLEAARQKCHAHLALEPEAAEPYFMLGILCEHAGQLDLADQYWRRCLYLQPDHYDALCHLALLTERHGDERAAAALKARAARIFQRQLA